MIPLLFPKVPQSSQSESSGFPRDDPPRTDLSFWVPPNRWTSSAWSAAMVTAALGSDAGEVEGAGHRARDVSPEATVIA